MATDADLRYATAEADRLRESRRPRPPVEERAMSDEATPLAQRLVGATRAVLNGFIPYADALDQAAAVATRAVLIELASLPDTPNRYALADLADSIEGGTDG